MKLTKSWKENIGKSIEGHKHYNWRGGLIRKGKYILVRTGTKKYQPEHRLIMEMHIGRRLSKKEIVHHKNEIGIDNNISNLELMANVSKHMSHHARKRIRNKEGKFV